MIHPTPDELMRQHELAAMRDERDAARAEAERLREERDRARNLLVSLIDWADDGMAATGTPESLAALARARVYLADDTERADDHA